MEQLIIIKTNKPQKICQFLNQEKQNYKVFNQTQRKKDLFANYEEATKKDKEREAEIALLDQAQEEDDEENEDWEWYDD